MQYKNLFIMILVSFIVMYLLMYVMVDTYANMYVNLNQVYMAGLMTAAMIAIELIVMGSMYTNKMLNSAIILASLLLCGVSMVLIRNQTGIQDKEFLKSMIPHHAAALLMCKKAQLSDPDIKELCKNIGMTQQSEIHFMKQKLEKHHTGMRDQEFLKSMIHHHEAALVMCEKAQLDDPEVQKLCENIVKSQQSEIDFMKKKLETEFHESM